MAMMPALVMLCERFAKERFPRSLGDVRIHAANGLGARYAIEAASTLIQISGYLNIRMSEIRISSEQTFSQRFFTGHIVLS